MGAVHTDFARAFTDGSTFWDPDRQVTLVAEVLAVGELSLPTGVIVVVDPWSLIEGLDPDALGRRAPAGRWRADVARANLATDGGVVPGEVAAMRLRFSDAGTVRWEAALTNDAGEPLGFGVDGGRISVLDRSVLDRAVCESIAEAAGADDRTPASIVRVPARETAELFISDSGMGDGAYPAWWGIDASGAVTELIVDFGILLRSTASTVRVPAALLAEEGHVLTPELLVAGAGIEVMDPADVPGPWSWDYSAFPEHNRPQYERPAIGLALRVQGAYDLTLLDGADEPVGVNPAMTGPFEDGSKVEFWADDPRLRLAQTLELKVFTGNVPLGPPPDGG
jgi:hypothetical protein